MADDAATTHSGVMPTNPTERGSDSPPPNGNASDSQLAAIQAEMAALREERDTLKNKLKSTTEESIDHRKKLKTTKEELLKEAGKFDELIRTKDEEIIALTQERDNLRLQLEAAEPMLKRFQEREAAKRVTLLDRVPEEDRDAFDSITEVDLLDRLISKAYATGQEPPPPKASIGGQKPTDKAPEEPPRSLYDDIAKQYGRK